MDDTVEIKSLYQLLEEKKPYDKQMVELRHALRQQPAMPQPAVIKMTVKLGRWELFKAFLRGRLEF